jgi:hypothetical protein
MDQDAEVVRYNTGKKIAQLNKVVAFLSFHLEERKFQGQFAASRYRSQEKQLLADLDRRVAAMFTTLDVDALHGSLQSQYAEKLDVIKVALFHKKEEAQAEICHLRQLCDAETQRAVAQSRAFMARIDEQIGKCKAAFDLAAIQTRVNQLNKDHQAAVKDQQFAARRRLKEFDHESRRRLQDAEVGYQRELDELKSKAARPDAAAGPKRGITALAQRVFDARQKLSESAQTVEQLRNVFKQKLTGLGTLAALQQHQMKVELQTNKEEFDRRKEESHQQLEAFEADLKALQQVYTTQKAADDRELKALSDKLIQSNIHFETEFAKNNRNLENVQRENDGLISLQQRNATELNKLKSRYQTEESKHSQLIENLRSALSQFSANDSAINMENPKENCEAEFRELETALTHERALVIENFTEEINGLRCEIESSRSVSVEFKTRDQELKKLQAILSAEQRTDACNLTLQFSADPPEFSENLSQIEAESDREFELSSQSSATQIAALENSCQCEFSLRSDSLQSHHNCSLSQIQVSSETSDILSDFAAVHQNLQKELDEIEVPQMKSGSELDDLCRQLDGLRESVQQRRGELVGDWESEADAEDARHRHSLFVHLGEQRVDRIASVDRRLLDVLDSQIGSLVVEMRELQFARPTPIADNAEQQRLRQELEELRAERRRRVRAAEALSAQMQQEIASQMEMEISQQNLEKERIQETLSEFQNSMEEQVSAQKNRRKSAAGEFDGKAAELGKEFGEMKMAKEAEFRKAANAKQQLVRDTRIDLEVNQVKRETEMKEERENREVKMAELERQLLDGLREFRAKLPTNSALDRRLGESMRRRNMAKDQVTKMPMRMQEESLIEKLETGLAFTTQQLATVGKELIQYRHRLIRQEDEYNCRFGADPIVGVLAPLKKPEKKRPTTTFGRRLPKLNSTLL